MIAMAKRPEVSIILPAHNEEENIAACVPPLARACRGLDYEILIVDDASRDGTLKVAKSLARKFKRVRVIHRTPPNGFGRAIKTGLENARGGIVIPFMADMSDDPRTIPRLVRKIEEGYDIAIGSRFVSGGKLVDYPLLKYLAHRTYSKVVSAAFMRNIKDISNAFKAYRREILYGIDITSDGFEITSEMILKPIALRDAKVAEVPTTWRNRKKGKAKFTGLYRQGWRYGRVLLGSLRLKAARPKN